VLFSLTFSLPIFAPKINFLAIIVLKLFFILLVIFDQKIHQNFCSKKTFSTLYLSSIFVAISYLISFYLEPFFDSKNSDNFVYKSPNYVNDQTIKIAKSSIKESDEILIIGSSIPDIYPVTNYLNKTNQTPALSWKYLYNKIEPNYKISKQNKEVTDYLFSTLKRQIADKKNQLIFIKKENNCSIGFLEYYFGDAEFKKTFSQNYVFLNRIIEKKPVQKVNFFASENEQENAQIITKEIEVYIRKND
jgi:hypothetical protein